MILRVQKTLQTLLFVLLFTSLSACTVGPDFKPPEPPQVKRYTKSGISTGSENNSLKLRMGQKVPEKWWELLKNEQINTLVIQAFKNNPDVYIAQASLRQAVEEHRAVWGYAFPEVDFNAFTRTQKTSLESMGVNNSKPNQFNLYGASVRVSYALDFFGAARRTIEAEQSIVDYRHFEQQATYATLAANVVTSAINEGVIFEQLSIIQSMYKAQDEQLQITKKQHKIGAASLKDVLNMQKLVAGLKGELSTLKKQQATIKNQLAILTGQIPAEYQKKSIRLQALQLPEEIPVSLPSELVRRRPDIQMAEAQLHQATANLGVAIAALLPRIPLSADISTQALNVHDLFKTTLWSLGASLTQPIFRAGTLNARKKAAQATIELAKARYQKTVLHAFKEVSDVLHALKQDAENESAQLAVLQAAKKHFEITQKSLDNGSINRLQFIQESTQYQRTQIAYLQSVGQRYTDISALFQALGGSFEQSIKSTPPLEKRSADNHS